MWVLPFFLQDYIPVDQEELRDYVKARLKVFYEEELDVPLVLFNEVLDHVLRIDRWVGFLLSHPHHPPKLLLTQGVGGSCQACRCPDRPPPASTSAFAAKRLPAFFLSPASLS